MKSTRKKYRTRKHRKGGRKVHEGISGIVFTPPLACEDTRTEYTTEEYVSKLTNKLTAEREYMFANAIRSIDPDLQHTIYAIKICKAKDVQTDPDYKPRPGKDWIVIMKHGGEDLLRMFQDIENYAYRVTDIKIDLNHIRVYIQRLYELGRFLVRMNESGLYHNDISYENLVWDYKDGNIRLIDFEKSSNVPSNRDVRIFMLLVTDTLRQIGMRNTVTPYEINVHKEYTLKQFKEDLEKIKNIKIE